MDLGRLYRDIVESSQDGIWVIDARGRTMYANPRIAELLGRPPDQVDGLTVFDALDATGRDQFAEHLLDLSRGRVHAGEVECQWVRQDGRTLWVLVRETALYDDHGKVQGFLHRVTDYTERRRLFEELRSNQEQLAEAQRIAGIGSYEWDVAADRITPSAELYALYGIPPAEFDGTYAGFTALVHPDDRYLVDHAVAQALAGDDTFDFTVRIAHEGAPAWVRGRGQVFRDRHGDPAWVRGTHQDVSDAKEAELFLTDLLGLNGLMQEVAMAANEAETLTEVLAVAKPMLLGRDDWVRARGYVPDPDAPDAPDGLRLLYLSEAERELDARHPGTAHLDRVLAARALRERAQVWDEDSVPEQPAIGFPVLVGQDVVAVIVITNKEPFVRHDMVRQMIDQVAVQLGRVAERERAARELAAARDAAMEASRQKSEFLATMSHEIRTPLNGVIGLNDLLLRTDLDPHQQRLTSGAQIASRALLAVINDILDFSKIEAGKLELENVDFEVRPVFDQVSSVLAESARAKGLELIVSCHPDVPEYLNGDPTRLAQVLTNLGSNAVKFTEQGEVFIRATAEDGGSLLRVEVSDTGVGVDPAKMQHIFEPFSQADASTTRQYGGTGLGLAISSEIVLALDGQIGAESTPGQGSTFWFTARLAPAGARPEDDHPPPRPLAGRRVLVVDDNANNRLTLSEHLGRWQALPTTAAGALHALELLRTASDEGSPYDAVLLDMAMPGHDGLHLARAVQAEEALAAVPLVMLTSSARPSDAELAEAGIGECLTKPVLGDEVLEALLRVLGQQAPTRSTTAVPGPDRAARPRRHLLVVEDNPVNQLVALGILETLGYSADTADDGREAVERWEGGRYDAVLMDVQMPRLDGYAATREIRARESTGRRTPVLAMTAAAVEGEREKCLAAGMDDFLTKPVDPDVLGAMLTRWLDGGQTAPATGQGAAATDGVLDVDRLEMLLDLDPGSTAYLDRAIGNFVSRAPDSVHALRSAVAAADGEALTHAAHRLKGSALNLGLPAVGHLAHELELLGDSGSTVGATPLLEDLEDALSRSVAAVLDYQRGYRSPAVS